MSIIDGDTETVLAESSVQEWVDALQIMPRGEGSSKTLHAQETLPFYTLEGQTLCWWYVYVGILYSLEFFFYYVIYHFICLVWWDGVMYM